MASFHLRFVGATALPKAPSQFDVDQTFRLSREDIEAVLTRFRADQRLGGALQLVFVRATGRSLAHVGSIPRMLLKSLCSALELNETAIGSLKTLYQRRSTLYACARDVLVRKAQVAQFSLEIGHTCVPARWPAKRMPRRRPQKYQRVHDQCPAG